MASGGAGHAAAKDGAEGPLSVLMIGSGEYTTGFAGGGESKSDKGAGVIGLVMFDLRTKGLVGDIAIAGVNGRKMPAIRAHMQSAIAERYPASGFDVSMRCFPADDAVDSEAYLKALETLPKGSAVTIFTPDDTHFEIAMACVKAGMHVLLTKPAVKVLEHHRALADAAKEAGVLVALELHKRFDPIYTDARDRIQALGDFGFFNAYMSQPKMQLHTFKAWAGKSSDISYYLNSHHIDFHEWACAGFAKPVRVTAACATGVATREIEVHTEDTITLLVQWQNRSGSLGAAVYTSSWSAPKSDVHSQQRFHYLGQLGELQVDQAHRGYSTSTDSAGYSSPNPLFMKYTPADGKFVGQLGYGYRSVEAFVEAVADIRAGRATPESFDGKIPTLATTFLTTAILEAGRRSLDAGGLPVRILYDGADPELPSGLEVASTE